MECAHKLDDIGHCLQVSDVACAQVENNVFQWHVACVHRLGDIIRSPHASTIVIWHHKSFQESVLVYAPHLGDISRDLHTSANKIWLQLWYARIGLSIYVYENDAVQCQATFAKACMHESNVVCAHNLGIIAYDLQTSDVAYEKMENDVFQWHRYLSRPASFTRGVCISAVQHDLWTSRIDQCHMTSSKACNNFLWHVRSDKVTLVVACLQRLM